MLNNDYKELLSRCVDEFAVSIILQTGESAYNNEYTLFYPVIGKDYNQNKNLLVVGQATNGWQPVFSLNDVRIKLSNIVEESQNYSAQEGDKCPLEWINKEWPNKDYSLFRSFFWNITYKLVKQFYNKNDQNWNNMIAWSNLMKIAPSTGSNPSDFEIDSQINYASKLFVKELEDLQPKNVLVMTNLKKWAEPVLENAKIKFERIDGACIDAVGFYQNSKIIVSKRGYLNLTHDAIISEISKHLMP